MKIEKQNRQLVAIALIAVGTLSMLLTSDIWFGAALVVLGMLLAMLGLVFNRRS